MFLNDVRHLLIVNVLAGDEEKDGAAEAAASEEKKDEEGSPDPVIPPGFAVAAERS